MIDWLVRRAAEDPRVATGLPPEGLLSAPETDVFNELRIAKRRKDWLLGRWTAKKLLQASAGNKNLSYNEISILAAPDGAPEVWLGEANSMEQGNLTLSISHSHGVAFCATAPVTYLLGADIEFIESRSLRFVEDYFTTEEKELVEQAPPTSRDCLITAIWSGKEAAFKAIRQGLRLDTRSISCAFPPSLHAGISQKGLTEWMSFSLRWSAAQENSGAPQLAGWWLAWGGFVLTLVVSAEPPIDIY